MALSSQRLPRPARLAMVAILVASVLSLILPGRLASDPPAAAESAATPDHATSSAVPGDHRLTSPSHPQPNVPVVRNYEIPNDLRTNKAAWLHTGKLFGMVADGWPQSPDAWDQAVADVGGVRPSSQMWFVRLDTDVDVAALMRSHDMGALPIVSVDPRRTGVEVDDEAYNVAHIAAGDFDAQFSSMANAIASSNVVVGVRFAHEMNGNWFPWGHGVNGNTAEGYVAAWRHVHDVFQAAGATNIIWIWSPNIVLGQLRELYPGDDYVDWLGLSGYFVNFDPYPDAPLDPDYHTLFDDDIAALRAFTDKPLMITETGADGGGTLKERFITDLLTEALSDGNVIGIVWFNKPFASWEADLRFNATPAAAAAFQDGITSGGWAYNLPATSPASPPTTTRAEVTSAPSATSPPPP